MQIWKRMHKQEWDKISKKQKHKLSQENVWGDSVKVRCKFGVLIRKLQSILYTLTPLHHISANLYGRKQAAHLTDPKDLQKQTLYGVHILCSSFHISVNTMKQA